MFSHLYTVPVLGVILIVAGIIVQLIIGRNRFYRRGPGGLQQYDSYRLSLLSRVLEWIFGKLALIMILFGMFLLGIHFFNKCQAEKHRASQLEESNLEDRYSRVGCRI